MKILYGQELIDTFTLICKSINSRIWVAVPYIGDLESVQNILGCEWLNKSDLSVKLLTDSQEISNLNIRTIKAFKKVGEARSLIGLHAKIYIVDNICIVTSANLTRTAFSKRHEIGISLSENETKDVIKLFIRLWNISHVIEEISLEQSNGGFSGDEEFSHWHLPKLWKLPPIASEINYWLKPIGTTEDPITEDRIFNRSEEYLHFAVNPLSVKEGDFIIAYGVGAKRILSVYKILTPPVKIDKQSEKWRKRFPWEVKGINLTKVFGKRWMIYNFYANKIVSEYLKEFPEGYITKVGGKTLGALNFSKDKIDLNPHFANYVIQKIIIATSKNLLQ